MTRGRLERAARRLVREDTFRLMVAPAIADLEFEQGRGRSARLRACAAVCRAVAGALVEDVRTDALGAVSALAAPTAARQGAYTLVGVSGALLLPFLWHIGSFAGPAPLLILLLVPSTLPLALLPALTIAARDATPRVRSTRGLLRIAIPIVLAICVSHFLLIGSTLTASRYLPRLLGAVAWLPTVALLAAAALSARRRTHASTER